jgi:hypothetical protein
LFLVPDVAFLFENPKKSSHGGIAGIPGQFLLDFGRRRGAEAIKDVHDVSFAACECEVTRFGHMLKA